MNIKELVEYLEKFDPEYEVCIEYFLPQFEKAAIRSIASLNLNIMSGFVSISDID